jgi:D-alanyl-D-alanine carboxypeptidase
MSPNDSQWPGCFWLALLVLGLCGCRSPLKNPPPEGQRSYQSLLQWTHDAGMPGAILLVKTPATNFVGSIGMADVKRKIPMGTNHSFQIGSVTKLFTGLVIAELHREGRLDADLVITNYLPPALTRRIKNSDRITVRQLTRHTSGIYNYSDSVGFMLQRGIFNRRGKWPAERELKFALEKPPRFEPGKGWAYSNSNFILLGMIIDQVTGEHHSAAIRKRLIDPLRLTNTSYLLFETPRAEMAHGYEKHFGFWEDATDWTPVVGGNAGLASTVTDLATFVRAVCGANSLLNPETRKLLKSNFRKGNADQPWWPVSGYDFGINHARAGDESATLADAPVFFGHAGQTSGYACFAWHEPKRDITIVFFGSSSLVTISNQKANFEIEHKLEKMLFDLALQPKREGASPDKP